MRLVEHLRLGKAVDAWVDAELDEAAAVRVARHVRRCPGCASAAQAARVIKRTLRRFRDNQPPRLTAARLRRFGLRLGHARPRWGSQARRETGLAVSGGMRRMATSN